MLPIFRFKAIMFQVVDGICRVISLWPSAEVQIILGLSLICIQFSIPLVFLIICYGKIVWVLTRRINSDLLKNNSETLNHTEDNAKIVTQATHPAKDKFQLARRNTIKIVLIVGLCFIICWSQNQVINFMYYCGYNLKFNNTYFQVTILMVFLNCTVNPFIYLTKYRDYQEALKNMFQCSKV